MNRINIKEIETIFELIVDKLKRDHVKMIEIEIDEYWQISTDEWANFEETPKPVVGSLSEDLTYLKRSIEMGEIFTYSDFDRVACILRVISEIKAPTN